MLDFLIKIITLQQHGILKSTALLLHRHAFGPRASVVWLFGDLPPVYSTQSGLQQSQQTNMNRSLLSSVLVDPRAECFRATKHSPHVNAQCISSGPDNSAPCTIYVPLHVPNKGKYISTAVLHYSSSTRSHFLPAVPCEHRSSHPRNKRVGSSSNNKGGPTHAKRQQAKTDQSASPLKNQRTPVLSRSF